MIQQNSLLLYSHAGILLLSLYTNCVKFFALRQKKWGHLITWHSTNGTISQAFWGRVFHSALSSCSSYSLADEGVCIRTGQVVIWGRVTSVHHQRLSCKYTSLSGFMSYLFLILIADQNQYSQKYCCASYPWFINKSIKLMVFWASFTVVLRQLYFTSCGWTGSQTGEYA